MINETETEEKAHLQGVKIKLQTAVERIDSTLRDHATKIQEQKTYLWEHRTDMDHAEKVSTRQSTDQRVLAAEAVLNNKKRIVKLLQSPYFGRFDFTRDGQTQSLAIYVGIHAFFDEDRRENLIYDWRAPIATMFYDYENRQGALRSAIRRYCRQNRFEASIPDSPRPYGVHMLESALNIFRTMSCKRS